MSEAVARFDEDDSIKPMLTRAVAGLSFQLSSMSMQDNYTPYIKVCSKQISLLRATLTNYLGTQELLSVLKDHYGHR